MKDLTKLESIKELDKIIEKTKKAIEESQKILNNNYKSISELKNN